MTDFDEAYSLAGQDSAVSIIDLELDDEPDGYPVIVVRHRGGAAMLAVNVEFGVVVGSVRFYAGDGTVVAEYSHVL